MLAFMSFYLRAQCCWISTGFGHYKTAIFQKYKSEHFFSNSHGIKGRIYAKDRLYKIEQIWEKFGAENCPSLEGKPKIFLVQACQGTNYDYGTELKQGTYTNKTDTGSWVCGDYILICRDW